MLDEIVVGGKMEVLGVEVADERVDGKLALGGERVDGG